MTDARNNNRVEIAIERLTQISGDLNKMVAVHELRLDQQEKIMETLEVTVEKRREEAEIKLKDVYETIRSEDKNIIAEISKFRDEHQAQYREFIDRISKIERIIWVYMGGFSVVAFLVSYGPNIYKLFVK